MPRRPPYCSCGLKKPPQESYFLNLSREGGWAVILLPSTQSLFATCFLHNHQQKRKLPRWPPYCFQRCTQVTQERYFLHLPGGGGSHFIALHPALSRLFCHMWSIQPSTKMKVAEVGRHIVYIFSVPQPSTKTKLLQPPAPATIRAILLHVI